MLNWLRTRDWTLLPYILVIVWGVQFASFLATIHHPVSQQAKAATQERPNDWLPWWPSAGDAEAFFTAAIAIFALVQIRDSRRSSERQLRAYIGIKPMRLMETQVGRKCEASFLIENKGQTPAYQVAYLATVDVLPYPLADNQGDLLVPHGKMVPDMALHSGAHIEGEAISEGALSADDLVRAIEGSEFRLYLFGLVTYRDIFGVRRKTKFCAYVDPDELKRSVAIGKQPVRPPAVKISWLFSHVHNDAT